MAYPITTLGKVCDVQLGKMLQPRPGSEADRLAPYLRAGSLATLSGAAVDLPEMYASAREISTYRVAEGDLVVVEGGDCGRTALLPSVPPNTIIQNSLHRLRPRADDVRFLRYALEAIYYSGWLEVLCNKATFGHLTREKLAALPIPNPAPTYQAVIAGYLDRETARIDALIAHRQRMAELVRERWDAVIRRATRLGIHADRPVRQSGVPWIGEVPEGWLVLPLRRVGRLIAGTAFPDAEQGRDDGPISYFKVADFNHPENSEYLTVAENTVTLDVARALHSPIYPAGAVVFPKIGAALLSNRRRLLAKASCTDQNVMGLVVGRGHPRFYYYLLQSFDFGRLRMPGPVPLLNEADAASILVPVPPDEEQTAIVTHLDARAASVGRALGALDQQLSRLQERRAALIAAAITGELEIPEVAA
jgi:type I restriction enzyme S subunit